MLVIDGSMGEGGGQILRTALSLSLLTGRPFTLQNIRAARSKPGLRPQHLAAVQAATRICRAAVEGDAIGSQRLVFSPGRVEPGRYHFNIGTAGSTSLLLQTVLLPLALADAPSELTIAGGTHVPWSPCFHYLEMHWRPLLSRLGIKVELSLKRAGFYPAGGGEVQARIPGGSVVSGIQLKRRGRLTRIYGISAIANLPLHIAERQREQALRRLAGMHLPVEADIAIEPLSAYSSGTLLMLLAEFEQGQACFSSLGKRGKPAERVADEAVDGLAALLRGEGAVDPWMADQLLLPLALAKDESALRTSEVTRHLLTNAEVIRRFLPVDIHVAGVLGEEAVVRVRP